LGVYYDPLHSIDYIDGSLFDASGKKIKSLKKSELKDVSGTGDESLADDNRLKYHNFYYRAYPYTVEYEWQVINRETYSAPRWYAQKRTYCAVENSKFTLVLPANYPLRYKAFNYPGEPQSTPQVDKITYLWTAKNLRAQKDAFGFPGWRYVTPTILIGPGDFQMDKYKGKLNSWEDFGKFQLVLNEGRDVLPDNVKQQVHALTDGKQDTREKVEALYDYLQKNTRYISVQFGVGGLQPFDAAYVAKNRYGDCKALSNFMYSLLKEAGIPSCYTIIKSGDDAEDIISDFPSDQFDHVVLCVPMAKDSIWLECTSQTDAPGYMGTFTGNRHALLVSPEGGKLVRTPTYGLKENWQSSKVKAVIDETGTAIVEQSANYSGTTQESYSAMIHYLSKDKLKEYLNRIIDLPTYDIVDFNYKEDRKAVPVVHEQLKLSVSNYGQITGKRLFVT
ncbi:MAG TPA: DUF3857 domain-containing protein, partial [Chitinophagaceae bacterium]|nr:DUF3857 domain-containing protein [Chitinophagaceae bacterium]